MEENKKAEVVELRSPQKTTEKPNKISYEQLEQIAHQLSEQVRNLYSRLQEAHMNNTFKSLDYLFKVLETSHVFSEEFVAKCVSEIESLIIFPTDEVDQEDESESGKE